MRNPISNQSIRSHMNSDDLSIYKIIYEMNDESIRF